MPTPRPRAVAYARVSTTRQLATDFDPEGNSIQTQREDCRSAAERYGYDLVDEYLEPGNSATSITGRPIFQQLLKRVAEVGDVAAVLIYRRSRAFRDEWDAAITGRELKDHGVRLISAHDYTDDTAEGQLVASVLDSISGGRSEKWTLSHGDHAARVNSSRCCVSNSSGVRNPRDFWIRSRL